MTITKQFDPSLPVQTRDGRKARIICTDLKADLYTILSLCTERDGHETITWHNTDGRCSWSAPEYDLINIPKKHTFWVNVYGIPGYVMTYVIVNTPEQRATKDHPSPLACIEIEFEEGQGP